MFEGLGFAELAGFGGHGEGGFEVFLGDEFAEVVKRYPEKFFPVVDLVDSELFKSAVELSFKAGGVVAPNHGVDIELEGDRGVAELFHAVEGFEAAGHSDLEHIVAEGTYI